MSATPITPSLLPLLRCPVTHSALTQAETDLIARANERVGESRLVDRLGQPVPGPIESGLVNADESLLIPVRGGIVVMLEDRLIPLSQLA